MRVGLTAAALSVGALAFAGTARAHDFTETAIIAADGDAVIVSGEAASRAFGASLPLTFSGSSAASKALVHFDVAGALPATALITEVRLEVFVTGAKDEPLTQALGVHRALEGWTEGTAFGASPFSDGGPSWACAMFNANMNTCTTAWSVAGGAYVQAASSTVALLTRGRDYIWFAHDDPAPLVVDVQGWVDDPSSNHGWFVLPEVAGDALDIGARESTVVVERPRLVVGFWSCDNDGDGYKDDYCGGPDCNSDDFWTHPGLPEVLCDDYDGDCDPTTVDHPDADADGVDDCIDNCALVANPEQEEVECIAEMDASMPGSSPSHPAPDAGDGEHEGNGGSPRSSDAPSQASAGCAAHGTSSAWSMVLVAIAIAILLVRRRR